MSEELAAEAANITATNGWRKALPSGRLLAEDDYGFQRVACGDFQSDLSLERALSKAMEQPIAEEVAFWNTVRDLADWDSNDFKARVMERLAQSGWPLTEAMLREHPKLLEFVDKLGRKLAAASEIYFTLRKPDELKGIERRRLSWLLELHPEKARAFAEFMIQEIEPPILKALRDARKAAPAPSQPGKEPPTDAEAFGWLAARLNLVTSARRTPHTWATVSTTSYSSFSSGVLSPSFSPTSPLRLPARPRRNAVRRRRRRPRLQPAAPPPPPASQASSNNAKKPPLGGSSTIARKMPCSSATSRRAFFSSPQRSRRRAITASSSWTRISTRSTLDGPIIGSEPFTPRDILHLLHRKYYTDLLEAIGPEMVEASKESRGTRRKTISGFLAELSRRLKRLPAGRDATMYPVRIFY